MAKICYHYCTLDSFHQIVATKSFRLSNVFFMNDSLELEWFMRISKSILSEFAAKFQSNSNEHQKYFQALDVLLSRSPLTHVYVGSFSKKPDDLSQWRAYSNDGSGVALGCDLHSILQKNTHVKTLAQRPFNVIYSESKARKTAEDLLKAYEMIGTSLMEVALRKIGDRRPETLALLVFTQLSDKSTIFKNPAFRGESEVRILAEDKLRTIRNPMDDVEGILRLFDRNIDFRVSNGRLIPFVPIEFPIDSLREVWLGPCFGGKKEEEVVRLFLKAHNCDALVKRSTASYRR